MIKIRILMALIVGAITSMAHAEIDLAGRDLTISNVSDLKGDVYTSETAATLTLDLNEDALAPKITGAIKLVKSGSGTLTFPEAQDYTGGTVVSGGYIAVYNPDWLGGSDGSVTMEGGGIDFLNSSSMTVSRSMTITPGSIGMIRQKSGAGELKLVTYAVTFKNATLKLERGGSEGIAAIKFERVNGSQFSLQDNATGGTLSVANGVKLNLEDGDVIGGANTQVDVTLHICEGGVVTAYGSHAPLGPKVVLEGGSKLTALGLKSTDLKSTDSSTTGIENLINANTWKSFDFTKKVTVVPGSLTGAATALVDVANMHLAHRNNAKYTEFDIAENAELYVDGVLWPAQAQKSVGIRKTGKGTLTLGRPLSNNGELRVEDGTLKLANKTYLGNAKLKVAFGAKVELTDGTILSDEFDSCAPGGFLSTADVWFDATQIDAVADGTKVSNVPNFGSCGGLFGAYPYGNIAQPTYKSAAINGKPALYFKDGNSSSGYYLEYENKTDQMTVFMVMRWDAWPKETNKGDYYCWHGPFSMAPAYAEKSDGTPYDQEDYTLGGVCYLQWGTPNVINVSYRLPDGLDTLGLSFDGGDTLTGTEPLLLGFSRNANDFTSYTWTSDGRALEYKTRSVSASLPKFNIDMISLGTRVAYWKEPLGCVKPNNSRGLKGYIGEFIVFSRSLDEGEMGFVQRYLQRKWGESTQEAKPEPEVAEGVNDIFLEVGGTGNAAGVNLKNGNSEESKFRIVKKGDGKCIFTGNHSAARKVYLKEGKAVISAKSGASSGAAIWLDASDKSTVTVNESGKVESVRNKGNFGGCFVQNTSKHPNAASFTPLPALGKIGELDAIDFDGNSSIALRDFVPAVANRRVVCIFGVMMRDSFVEEGGKGMWGGPFSLYLSTNTQDDNYVSLDNNIHWEEYSGKYVLRGGDAISADISNGTPYVFSTWQEYADKNYQFDWMESGELQNSFKAIRESYGHTSTTDSPMVYDVINLGGRCTIDGAPQWWSMHNGMNRMWDGKIGEFIVLDRTPVQSDVAAIVKYLREKWIYGNNAAEVPSFLKGGTVDEPVPGETAELKVGGNAAIELEDEVSLQFGKLELEDGAKIQVPLLANETAGIMNANEVIFGGKVNLFAPSFRYDEMKVLTAETATGTPSWRITSNDDASRWKVVRKEKDFILRKKFYILIIR